MAAAPDLEQAPARVRIEEQEQAKSAPSRDDSADLEADLDEDMHAAERLFSEKRWGEAAVAFRALLQRAPHHPLARTWRERVRVAERAHAEAAKPRVPPASPPH